MNGGLERLTRFVLSLLTSHPWRTTLLMTLLVALPTVITPKVADDHNQRLMIRAFEGDQGVPLFYRQCRDPFGFLNLFSFMPGDKDYARALMQDGQFPWWTYLEVKAKFYRPLSSLLGLIDHRLFGEHDWLAHLHSSLWYVALVAAVGLLFRRNLPASLWALSLFLFALDETHWMTVGWLSNRNALVAGVFGVLGLHLHIRWRKGWALGFPLSMLAFILALLGGEAALGAFAYLGAYQLFGPEPSLQARAKGVAPALLLGVGWALFYRAYGFGTSGMGAYLDPVQSTTLYLQAALERGIILLAVQVAGVSGAVWTLLEASRYPYLLLCASLVALVALLTVRLWPRLRPEERATLRWILPGALMSLLPVLAVFPHERLLLLPGIGGSVLTATLLLKLLEQLAASPRRWQRLAFASLVFIHLMVPFPLWQFQTAAISFGLKTGEALISEGAFTKEDFLTQEILLLHASDPLVSFYLPAQLMGSGWPAPYGWHSLGMDPHPHRLTRVDETTLEITSLSGAMLGSLYETLFRHPDLVLEEGYSVSLRSFDVRIEEMSLEGPTRISLHFHRSPESGGFLFLAFLEGKLERIDLPKIGESRDLPYFIGPMFM